MSNIYIKVILFSDEKGRHPDVYNNMDEAWGHCVKWNKLDGGDKYCMVKLICENWKKKCKTHRNKREEVEKWLPGGRGDRMRLAKGYKLSAIRWIRSEDLMYNNGDCTHTHTHTHIYTYTYI